MNKKEIIKQIKDVMSGVDAHTRMIVGKKNGKWITQTGVNRFDRNDFSDWEDIKTFSHCCNEMTLREARELLDD